ncbi:uncharacterized protein [Panulirus ornatus]|uniref:uncharacterized protein n=1 Tax=Panulirus ornatus TaxID=150431 RepID=UPI003A8531CA
MFEREVNASMDRPIDESDDTKAVSINQSVEGATASPTTLTEVESVAPEGDGEMTGDGCGHPVAVGLQTLPVPPAAHSQTAGSSVLGGDKPRTFETLGTQTPCAWPPAAPAGGRRQPYLAARPSAAKVARVVYLKQPQQPPFPGRVAVLRAGPGRAHRPRLLLCGEAAARMAALPKWTPAQLLQERDRLRRENQELHGQVSHFQQLFQNREQLIHLLRRLGIEAS